MPAHPNTGIHARKHRTFRDNCFACKAATVALSAAATPTRRANAAKPRNEKEG